MIDYKHLADRDRDSPTCRCDRGNRIDRVLDRLAVLASALAGAWIVFILVLGIG
jgi:hypothetical protein